MNTAAEQIEETEEPDVPEALQEAQDIVKKSLEQEMADNAAKAMIAEAAKDVPKGPVFVTEVDRLKAENINLRLLDATNRETIAHLALQEATRNKQIANDAVMVMRGKLEEEYEVDFNTHLIDEVTGEVKVRPGVNLAAIKAIKDAQAAQAKALKAAQKPKEDQE